MKRLQEVPLFAPVDQTGADDHGRILDTAKALSLEFKTKLPGGSVFGPLFDSQLTIDEGEI
jgi:hypothetical protein